MVYCKSENHHIIMLSQRQVLISLIFSIYYYIIARFTCVYQISRLAQHVEEDEVEIHGIAGTQLCTDIL